MSNFALKIQISGFEHKKSTSCKTVHTYILQQPTKFQVETIRRKKAMAI